MSKPLRSRAWFNNPANPGMTALYLERYLNFGLTLEELQSDKPIIGIAQTGSDLAPCNRHHIVLAERVAAGIRAAGGVPLEFPVHPIQETGKRPTAALDRNLAYLGLVEVLYGYPLDGVVLTIGCDKTTPACLMAAATVNLPAIALSVGPMLNGWHKGERTGSGTIVWKARQIADGTIDYAGFIELVCLLGALHRLLQHHGHGDHHELAGRGPRHAAAGIGCHSGALPRTRANGLRNRQAHRRHGDRGPEARGRHDARVLSVNAIVVTSAIGGSTNAPIHIAAIAKHVGVPLSLDDWQEHGHHIPLLVNLQPAGEYLGEDYHHAGGVPAVVNELMKQGLIHEDAMTVNGRSIGDNWGREIQDGEVIRPIDKPLKTDAGFIVMRGNLFDSAMMKTSVISEEFRLRYLCDPQRPDIFEGSAVVFDGPEDYHARIDDPALNIGEYSLLVTT